VTGEISKSVTRLVPVARTEDRAQPFLRRNLAPPSHAAPLLARGRLLELLNDGTTARLTLMLAPAGYGKSTIATQWREDLMRRGAKVAWLTVQPADRDPVRFITALSQALECAGLTFGSPGAPSFPNIPDLDVSAVLQALLLEISQSDLAWIVVLDEYECVGGTEIDRVVEVMLHDMPENMHLAIATRVRPTLSLARLELRGLAREVGPDALRFSREEVKQFLVGQFSARDVAILTDRTEGWPVALQLARLWVTGGHGSPHELTDFSGRTRQIASYLAEQILSALPDEVRIFLIDVSVLTTIDAACADAIRETTDSRRLLAAAADLQPLVVEIAGKPTRFRLHALFVEFLCDLLERSEGNRLQILHRRASSYYARIGDIVEAVRHACLAGDPAAAAQLAVDAGGIRIYLVRGIGQLRAIVSMLPQATVDAFPRLALARALILMKDGRVQDGWELFQRIRSTQPEGQNGREDETTLAFAIDAKVLDAIYSQYHNVVLSGSCILELEELIHQASTLDPLIAAVLQSFLAASYQQQGLLDLAETTADQARWHYQRANSEYASAFIQLHYALIDFARGRMMMAQRRLNIALRLTQHRFRADTGLGTMAKLLSAEARYEQNDIAGSAQLLNEAMNKTNTIEEWFDFYAAGHGTAIRIAALQDGFETAIGMLDRAAERSGGRPIHAFWRFLMACKVTLLTRSGDIGGAERILRQLDLNQPKTSAPPTHWREREAIDMARARVAIGSADWVGARQVLSGLREDIVTAGRGLSAIRLQLLETVVVWSEGSRSSAYQMLRETMLAAYPENLMRIFLDEGAVGVNMLAQLLPEVAADQSDPSCASLAQALLRAGQSTHAHVQGLLLSAREFEVIGELCAGRSNKLIARRLGISERTVKFHLANLYGKLEVNDRKAALTAARRLGLIRSS
jgi:LuxR family maltose regulon positive regulatory protein